MPNTESYYKRAVVVKRTILGYEVNSNQNVWANFLIPSIIGCLLYIVQTGADIGVVYGHFRGNNPIWASLTLFFMCCPVLACFIWVVTTLEFWPEEEGFGVRNIKWIILKILQHLFFPIWSMWRYAEKIFWSIDALVNSDDEDAREEALENVTAPRTIEFYFFLQAFLQSIPQVLLQIHILMRYTSNMELETIQAQTMSIFINLFKVSIVATLYQRFKTQKIGGKDYPWYKSYKYEYDQSVDVVDAIATRSAFVTPNTERNRGTNRRRRRRRSTGIIYATKENASRLKREYESANNTPLPPQTYPNRMERRTSSDLYLLPMGIVGEDEVDSGPIARETSVLDGPPRMIFRTMNFDETDSPRRLREIKSLPDDDIVGKLIACVWWFCFLAARMLALSSFAYFYPRDVFWLIAVHFTICLGFLLYDVQTYVVRRTKAVFYIFIGFIFIFLIIEFMKKFKKTKFIYYGFFGLVYLENLVTCLIWWLSNLETDEVQNDWWFKFIFYVVLGSTILSFSSMLFYLFVNKPESVVVDEEVVEGNTI